MSDEHKLFYGLFLNASSYPLSTDLCILAPFIWIDFANKFTSKFTPSIALTTCVCHGVKPWDVTT